jgi:hypothetical protein
MKPTWYGLSNTVVDEWCCSVHTHIFSGLNSLKTRWILLSDKFYYYYFLNFRYFVVNFQIEIMDNNTGSVFDKTMYHHGEEMSYHT